jgi:hypothetical protein
MDLETLIEEGRRLSRPCLALTTHASGELAGVWDERPSFMVGDHEYEHVISVLGDLLPVRLRGVLHVSIDLDNNGGQAILDPDNRIPSELSFTRLYAREHKPLAPSGVLENLGRPAISSWFKHLNSANSDDWEVAMQYWEAWLDETHRLPDLYAFVGGWHEGWPSESWSERAGQQLLLWTFRRSDPFVQVWFDDGAISVVQRLST